MDQIKIAGYNDALIMLGIIKEAFGSMQASAPPVLKPGQGRGGAPVQSGRLPTGGMKRPAPNLGLGGKRPAPARPQPNLAMNRTGGGPGLPKVGSPMPNLPTPVIPGSGARGKAVPSGRLQTGAMKGKAPLAPLGGRSPAKPLGGSTGTQAFSKKNPMPNPNTKNRYQVPA